MSPAYPTGPASLVGVTIDTSALKRLSNAFAALADRQQHHVIRRALNRTGDMAYTRVVRVLAEETGAQQKAVRAALRKQRASHSALRYEIVARGGFIPLRDFGARQTRKGVSAAPWGVRRVFPGAFIVKSKGGHVFKRTGKKRLPIEKLWGPSIPRQMLKGATGDTVNALVASHFVPRVLHETDREIAKVKAEFDL